MVGSFESNKEKVKCGNFRTKEFLGVMQDIHENERDYICYLSERDYIYFLVERDYIYYLIERDYIYFLNDMNKRRRGHPDCDQAKECLL